MAGDLMAAQELETQPSIPRPEIDILNNNLQDLRQLNSFETTNPVKADILNSQSERLHHLAANAIYFARKIKLSRRATIAAATTVMAIGGSLAVPAKKAKAYPTVGSPELTPRELITTAQFSAGIMCRTIAKIEATGTYEKGKCSYIHVYNCIVGGAKGQPHYIPPIRKNEGRCGTNFSVDFKNGEPIERGMRLICQSRRVGVRKVKIFVRNREGQFYARWKAVPDLRRKYSIAPKCIPVTL